MKMEVDLDNPEIQWALSRPNFWCARYARTLRKGGHDIAQKSEAEQGAVIAWLLTKIVEHGKDFRDKAAAELDKMDESC